MTIAEQIRQIREALGAAASSAANPAGVEVYYDAPRQWRLTDGQYTEQWSSFPAALAAAATWSESAKEAQ